MQCDGQCEANVAGGRKLPHTGSSQLAWAILETAYAILKAPYGFQTLPLPYLSS